MKAIPLSLTVLRATLGPVVALLAITYPTRPAFALCLIAAFLSDVFDGIAARRLNVVTPLLRRLDSMADTLFYVAASFAVWHLYPEAIIDRRIPLVILVILEIARYGFDLAKFGREAGYHMWSSKLWVSRSLPAFTRYSRLARTTSSCRSWSTAASLPMSRDWRFRSPSASGDRTCRLFFTPGPIASVELPNS